MIDLRRFTDFVLSANRYVGRGQRIYEIRMHPDDWRGLRERIDDAYGNMSYSAADPYGHGHTYNQLMGQNIQLDREITIGTIGIYPQPPVEIMMGHGPTIEPPKEPPVSMKDVCSSMIQNLTEEKNTKPLSGLTVANLQQAHERGLNETRIF